MNFQPQPRNSFRTGPLGALMDELERAAGELRALIGSLTDEEFEAVRDPEAPDEFRSIQSVVHHVVRAGTGHANYVRLAFSMEGAPAGGSPGTRTESAERLQAMVAYWEATLEGRWEMTDEEIEAIRIESGWGVVYNLEQMFEHAIVHILRHRRQIERFLRV